MPSTNFEMDLFVVLRIGTWFDLLLNDLILVEKKIVRLIHFSCLKGRINQYFSLNLLRT